MIKICFTTCANDGFLEGLTGLIRSIRKFYAPIDADIVVFFEERNDFVAAFCKAHAVELHYFEEINSWRKPLLQGERFATDAKHFYHDDFHPAPGLPHHTDRSFTGVAEVHHLHPLNVKAHCTAYCACILKRQYIVHIDSDAFLLGRIDDIFARHAHPNTVIGFDDGNEELAHLETLYGISRPAAFDGNHYGINAGIVFYVNGSGLQEMMMDFCFYIDSCYHYTHSGSFADQGVLRALIAKHHILGTINFIKLDGANWNPTWFRADRLTYDGERELWINDANGCQQHIWHGAGGEKLWTGGYSSSTVNEAWKWVGGTLQPKPYDQVKGSLIKPHCLLLCHAIDEHFRDKAQRCLRIVEIGTQYGRTAIAFCSILERYGYDCHVDTFDTYAPSPDYEENYATRPEAQSNVDLFDLKERITLHTVDAFADISAIVESADIVFIDGDHRFKHVIGDCVAARKIGTPGGLILGDDFQLESVRNAVWSIFDRGSVIALNHSLWAFALPPQHREPKCGATVP